MNDNIKEFIKLVEETSKSSNGDVQYAYVAGYYESIISGLVRDIPEVAEFIQSRVDFINRQNKKAA